MTERQPVGYVKNVAGAHHHRAGKIQMPRGVWTAIFDQSFFDSIKRNPSAMSYEAHQKDPRPVEYLYRDGAELKLEPAPVPKPTVASDAGPGPDPIKLEDLSWVEVHGQEQEDPNQAHIQIQSGRVVSIREALDVLIQAGHATFNQGWITLFPGTEDEVKSHGFKSLLQEIRANPGILMAPGDPDAA